MEKPAITSNEIRPDDDPMRRDARCAALGTETGFGNTRVARCSVFGDPRSMDCGLDLCARA
jgi:hypothetical protein